MDFNPYEQPRGTARRPFGWRRFWRRVSFVSMCSTAIFILVDVVVARIGKQLPETHWFIILSGLLALFVLMSILALGISSIGWILSPRSPSDVDQG